MGRRGEWGTRPGRESDLASVLALWREAGSRPSGTDDDGALRLLIERDPDALLIAEADGEVVGSLIVGWDGWRAGFYRLAVRPDRRRRGIALALVREGERRLRELGAVRLTAIVATEDEEAVALWEAAGYRHQPEVGRFVRMLDRG